MSESGPYAPPDPPASGGDAEGKPLRRWLRAGLLRGVGIGGIVLLLDLGRALGSVELGAVSLMARLGLFIGGAVGLGIALLYVVIPSRRDAGLALFVESLTLLGLAVLLTGVLFVRNP